MDLSQVLRLFRILNPETLALFEQFIQKANAAQEPAVFVREALKRALREDEVVVTVGRSTR